MKLNDGMERVPFEKCVGIVVYPVTWEEAYVFVLKEGTAFLPIIKYNGKSK